MESGAGARTAPTPTATGAVAAPSIVRDYLTLTKPKVQSLLLFTTVTTMYVAGDPSLGLVFLTCLGGALSAGGAGAINHAVDRDMDASPPLPRSPSGLRSASPRSSCSRSRSTRWRRRSRSRDCLATSSSTPCG
jgi:hypothetical protein